MIGIFKRKFCCLLCCSQIISKLILLIGTNADINFTLHKMTTLIVVQKFILNFIDLIKHPCILFSDFFFCTHLKKILDNFKHSSKKITINFKLYKSIINSHHPKLNIVLFINSVVEWGPEGSTYFVIIFAP